MKREPKPESTVNDPDGALTGATGSLTPTSSDEEFIPAERLEIEAAPPHVTEGDTEEIPEA